MTLINEYLGKVKEAGKFLLEHPDWQPIPSMAQALQNLTEEQAIYEIVLTLTED